jgi:nucleoside-diphosphate-sugar epimerase
MNRVYNLANEGQQYSIRETAEMALAAGGGMGSLRFAEQESPDGGGNSSASLSRESGAAKAAPQYSAFAYVPMDMSRMAALGWQPEVGLMEGLERTIAYFRS